MSGLPDGWAEASLEEAADVNPGRIRGIPPDTAISFVPMPSVSDIDGEITSSTVRQFQEVSQGYTHFKEGDVIFAKITPCMENGKIAVARSLENGTAVGSTEFHVVRPLGGMSADYIWRFLRQKAYRDDAEASMTGAVGQRRVPASFVKETRLPVAPLPEQRRIVAKIDSLAARSRRARENLDHIPRLVEKYKRAVLAAAYKAASGDGYEQSTLGELATEVRNGLSKKPTDEPGGTPILRISAVRPLKVNLSDIRYYPSEEVPPTATLRNQDLLFTRYNGNPDYTAICGRVRDLGIELTYPDKLIRVRLGTDADPAFVELICACPRVRAWLSPYIKSAAGQHGISGADLKRLPIPLPPLAVQAQLVRRTEAAFTWIELLASDVGGARKLIDKLDQAVFARAFRGELVPQDPDDEPASVLLERIRVQRAATPKAKRGRRKKADA